MSARSFTSPAYRYGFNGKEKDDEVKGQGDSYDFGARLYDTRLGTWLSLDPMQQEYMGWSPYNFSLDSPLQYNDPNGEWVERKIKKYYKDEDGNLVQKVGFKGLFQKTVHKDITYRIHNAKLYLAKGQNQLYASGSYTPTEADVKNEADYIQQEIIQTFNRPIIGTVDGHPYNYISEDSKRTLNFNIEFVGGITPVNSLKEVNMKGPKRDNLIVLANDEFVENSAGGNEGGVGGYAYGPTFMMISLGMGSYVSFSKDGDVPTNRQKQGGTYSHETGHQFGMAHLEGTVMSPINDGKPRYATFDNIWNAEAEPNIGYKGLPEIRKLKKAEKKSSK